VTAGEGSDGSLPAFYLALEQGDALRGIAHAEVTLGSLNDGRSDVVAADDDLIAIPLASPTGWHIVLSQDCDIVRTPDEEPTICVAAVVKVGNWPAAALADGYDSRLHALPEVPELLDEQGMRPMVDLATISTVSKAALDKAGIERMKPFTEPQRRKFQAWVGHRFGRLPFPDEVSELVLEPAHEARARALKSFKRHGVGSSAADATLVAGAERWMARQVAETRIEILAVVTTASLSAVGLIGTDGLPVTELIEKGLSKLHASTVELMERARPGSGYDIAITTADLETMPAAEYLTYALLIR